MTKIFLLIGLCFSLLIIPIWFIMNYNNLVESKGIVDRQWSIVETSYQKRIDLVDNLLQTVKGSQFQEQTVFTNIANARKGYAGSNNTDDKINNANKVESSLSRLLVITENYPELKSNDNIKSLLNDLKNTENEIMEKRELYNIVASNYNINIKMLPKSIFAHMFNFKEAKIFESDDGAEKAPKIKF